MKIVNCGEIKDLEGEEATLDGWCRYIRDHGGKLFIDLADRYGLAQLVFEGDIKKKAELLGREYVIKVEGVVRKREPETIDETNPTGHVEVLVKNFEVINESKVPPFEIIDEKEAFLPDEYLRFKYRYLDLRRRKMLNNILFRDAITKAFREFFWSQGFLELETPILIRDTYDASGSRTFIVPSRIEKGKFYALHQSPQIYKQLCMIAGLDKYFQIARVFRDEDPREDRQPEFTQVDLEVSFKDEKYIQTLIENAIKYVFKKALNKDIETPFPHIEYADAIKKYGNDKPDLRFKNEIVDITDIAIKSEYNIIKRVAQSGKVKAITFEADYGNNPKFNEKYFENLIELAKGYGLKGLTWLFFKDNKLGSIPSSIAESLRSVEGELKDRMNLKEGDILLIAGDLDEDTLLEAMAKVRRKVGIDVGKFEKEYAFVWVDHFPLFEKDKITGELKPAHNPFVAPTEDTVHLLDTAPEKVLGKRYDLVLNGVEVGGGSLRIHKPELQRKVLKIMGLSDEEIDRSLGFLIEALSYGAPIHGGIALGLDRFVATVAGEDNIKEFILFPKTKKFESPLDGSPSEIDPKRLQEDYNIKIEKPL
jgi:aspartyl-tRNA synthetase